MEGKIRTKNIDGPHLVLDDALDRLSGRLDELHPDLGEAEQTAEQPADRVLVDGGDGGGVVSLVDDDGLVVVGGGVREKGGAPRGVEVLEVGGVDADGDGLLLAGDDLAGLGLRDRSREGHLEDLKDE